MNVLFMTILAVLALSQPVFTFSKSKNSQVCFSPTVLANPAPKVIKCKRKTRIRILKATFGLQSRVICPQFLIDPELIEIKECEESVETTRIIKEKCDNQKSCKIDFSEPIPHKCENDMFSYMNVSYKCIPPKFDEHASGKIVTLIR